MILRLIAAAGFALLALSMMWVTAYLVDQAHRVREWMTGPAIGTGMILGILLGGVAVFMFITAMEGRK